MDVDIFLSYSRADHQLAQAFVHAAAARGVNVWFDDRIEGGQDWREKIVQALRSAKALVILFSEHSNSSTQLIKELAIADNLRKRVVPVLVSNCEPRGAYLYELASLNWINIHPNPETRLAPLVDNLITQLDLHGGERGAASTTRRAPLPSQEPSAAVAPDAQAPSPTPGDDESWFPLGRYDLYLVVPILLGAFLIGFFGTGDDKYGGLGASAIASFIYMVIIGVRNARLNRSIFSGKSFASYIAVMVIGTSPVLVSGGTVHDNIAAFFGLLVLSLVVAVIANVVQGVSRKSFQRSIFRNNIVHLLGPEPRSDGPRSASPR
jgi:TIR domain